jgi:ubiquinone/menaquinone biosynthesis C-methylase UbiE
MNPNQALWEKGDFTKLAALMRQSGEELVASLGVAPPLRVLDLGCGDGTTALPLAQLGADVTGIDIARNLVEAGNARATAAKLSNLRFEWGDACDLSGVADASFDLSVTCFGAMFAPKPFEVAKELVRVTKPGGRIEMGNWIPNDPTSFVSQVLKISAAFTPPPPEGFISPMTWGVEAQIRERFAQAGVAPERITLRQDTFYFRSPDKSPAEVVYIFKTFYGPTMNAFAAAEQNGKSGELHQQLIDLAKSQNAAAEGGTLIPATFLRVSVQL